MRSNSFSAFFAIPQRFVGVTRQHTLSYNGPQRLGAERLAKFDELLDTAHTKIQVTLESTNTSKI